MAKKSKKAPVKKAAKKAAPKKSAPKKAASKVAAAKKAAPKKAAPKKSAPKKSASKKVTPKKVAKKAAPKAVAKPAPQAAKKPAQKSPTLSKSARAFFAPIEDRVLIARTGESDRTPGGLYIPETAMDRPNKGKVLAVGKGRVNKKGHLRPLDVQVGDIVLFGQYVGQQLEHSGQEYVLLREDEILGVVEE